MQGALQWTPALNLEGYILPEHYDRSSWERLMKGTAVPSSAVCKLGAQHALWLKRKSAASCNSSTKSLHPPTLQLTRNGWCACNSVTYIVQSPRETSKKTCGPS